MEDSSSQSSPKSHSLSKKISQVFSALKNDPTSAFQLRFKDRQYAANILAATLQDKMRKDLKERADIVILGIPRGGMVVANIVADKLKIKNFGIVIPRKLTDVDNKEQAIGAIMEDGTIYLDENLISDLQIDSEYLEKEKQNQLKEIQRRKELYVKSDSKYDDIINNRTVIVVDDGAASGYTVAVVSKWIKKNYRPKKLVIAIPVVPKQNLSILKKEYDTVIAVTTPSKYFHFVGQYYQSFNPVDDSEVIKIIESKRMS